MIEHITKVRVRYAETDKMGFVYYGNYPTYYEIGRTELLRSLGSTYRKLEEEGVLMPVINLQIQYKKPAQYDDFITIKTVVKDFTPARITFTYTLFNEMDELLNTGETTLIFMNPSTMKPIRAPQWFLKLLKEKN